MIRVTSLKDIASALERIGALAGTDAAAHRAADGFRRRLAGLRAAYAGRAPVKVFYEISAKPLYTVSGRHTISQVISLCGGHNVFFGLDELAPAVSIEAVLARDPEAIITGADAGNGQARLAEWRRWPDLAAVRAGNLFSVDPDLLARATPRILDGAKVVCRALDTARRRLGLDLAGSQSLARKRGLRQSTSSPRS
jgi:iron complex transport system substrate-binding protein